MDAVKLLKEWGRLCNGRSCGECPIYIANTGCWTHVKYPEKAVAIIEQWSNEHPIMTNKMKFEEVFGKTCDESGELVLTRPSWWDEEYKEPKGEE